jgi:hypothetical protein
LIARKLITHWPAIEKELALKQTGGVRIDDVLESIRKATITTFYEGEVMDRRANSISNLP